MALSYKEIETLARQAVRAEGNTSVNFSFENGQNKTYSIDEVNEVLREALREKLGYTEGGTVDYYT